MEEFLTYLREASAYIAENKHVRCGQAYYNVLYEVSPGIAASIDGTPLDPFFNDRAIPDFLSFVCEAMSRD